MRLYPFSVIVVVSMFTWKGFHRRENNAPFMPATCRGPVIHRPTSLDQVCASKELIIQMINFLTIQR